MFPVILVQRQMLEIKDILLKVLPVLMATAVKASPQSVHRVLKSLSRSTTVLLAG